MWWNGPVSSFEHGIGADQLLVPRHAHPEVSNRDRDVRDCGKVGHATLLSCRTITQPSYTSLMFTDAVQPEAELRELYRHPASLTKAKVIGQLDQHARTFIDLSPFVLLGTASPDGTADVSPKGGPPGFVVVLDDQHLAIPDLAGNNLLDSITNVVHGSGIGLLFLIPGVEETLRVNGHACLTTDSPMCSMRAP